MKKKQKTVIILIKRKSHILDISTEIINMVLKNIIERKIKDK